MQALSSSRPCVGVRGVHMCLAVVPVNSRSAGQVVRPKSVIATEYSIIWPCPGSERTCSPRGFDHNLASLTIGNLFKSERGKESAVGVNVENETLPASQMNCKESVLGTKYPG